MLLIERTASWHGVSICVIFFMVMGLLGADTSYATDTVKTTQPALADTDGDGFPDGPDTLADKGETGLWMIIGEDRNGNGKYEPEGADGILGTLDDETDPNDRLSHPKLPKSAYPYKDIAFWHDLDGDGIPDANEDINLNGIVDDGEFPFDERGEFSSKRIQINYINARYINGSIGTEINLLSNLSAIANFRPNASLLRSYWEIKVYANLPDTKFGDAQIVLHYLDSDLIVGSNTLNENHLILYRADNLNGPWKQIASGYHVDKDKNLIFATISHDGYFVVCEEPIPEINSASQLIHVGSTRATKSIHDALNQISPGGTIVVDPGIYNENIVFPSWVDENNSLNLISTNPSDRETYERTVIDGGGHDAVIWFYGDESAASSIKGFTICNGENDTNIGGGGIAGQGTNTTIEYNRIINNHSLNNGGGISNCDGILRYNLIAYNQVKPNVNPVSNGGGLALCDGNIEFDTIYGNVVFDNNNLLTDRISISSGGGIFQCKCIKFKNCILWHNEARNKIVAQTDMSSSFPENCCIEDWNNGGNNSSTEPSFVSPPTCDFTTMKDAFKIGLVAFPAGSDGAYDGVLPSDVNEFVTLSQVEIGNVKNITINWSAYPASNISSYNVYRSNSIGQGYLRVNTNPIPASQKYYSDQNIPESEFYSYKVTSLSLSNMRSPTTNLNLNDQSSLPDNPLGLDACLIILGNKENDYTIRDTYLPQLHKFKYTGITTSGRGVFDILKGWRKRLGQLTRLVIMAHGTPNGLCGYDPEIEKNAFYIWHGENNGIYYPMRWRYFAADPNGDYRYAYCLPKDDTRLNKQLFLSQDARLLYQYPEFFKFEGYVGNPNPNIEDLDYINKYMYNDALFAQNSLVVVVACLTGRNQPYNYKENESRFLHEFPVDEENNVPWDDHKENYGFFEPNWKRTTPYEWDTIDMGLFERVTRMENPQKMSFCQALSGVTNGVVVGATGLTQLQSLEKILSMPCRGISKGEGVEYERYPTNNDTNGDYPRWYWRHHIWDRWSDLTVKRNADRTSSYNAVKRRWRIFKNGAEILYFNADENGIEKTCFSENAYWNTNKKYFADFEGQKSTQSINLYNLVKYTPSFN